jgi:ribosome-binding ATPase YchF (GTP1/OBG family)
VERFGFVGLPNAGKSSLYNALAGGGALAAPYAFATRDPNIGVAKVLDQRLDALAEMSASRNVVPASVQFVDIGGLVEGACSGPSPTTMFPARPIRWSTCGWSSWSSPSPTWRRSRTS